MPDYDLEPLEPDERIVIVGGPMTGKTTLAARLRAQGWPTYCGDPRSLDRYPVDDVTYLPEGLEWSQGSLHVANLWFSQPGPWVAEGQVTARALRKLGDGLAPDRVVVLSRHHPSARPTAGQAAMHKAVMTVWQQVAYQFASIAEYPQLRA